MILNLRTGSVKRSTLEAYSPYDRWWKVYCQTHFEEDKQLEMFSIGTEAQEKPHAKAQT